jgi:integrase/recombinase XerD
LSVRSQFNQLAPVRTFFRWLAKNNHLLSNPAANLTMPRLEKKLPRSILTVEEVNQVLNSTDVKEPLGIRDRAILETLYATGIRRRELVQLKIEDVDLTAGANGRSPLLIVRLGKGNKDRVLPLGERAVLWINKYLREVRDSLVREMDDRALFLSKEGKAFHPNALSFLVLKYVKTSKIGKFGSCHMFRHTMATQMLEGGADIRFIQQMLGHSSLKSTEIYTQVSLRQLREVFMETHPAARLKKQDS